MDKHNIEILIVTRSIPLADGLYALLKAIPQIHGVAIARSLANAYQQIEDRKPRIVLIDSVLSGNKLEAPLERIRSLSPETQRVLLVNEVQEVGLIPRYAEAILIKGIAPSAVAGIVTNLLSEKGAENERDDSN